MSKMTFLTLVMIGLLLAVIACKPSQPATPVGGSLGHAGSSQSSEIGSQPTPDSQVKVVGKGKVDLILGLVASLPDGTLEVSDTGKIPFNIQNAAKNGVPVFNKFTINGEGKLDSVAKWKSSRCGGNVFRQALVFVTGDMTGNFDPSHPKDACILNMKFEASYPGTTASLFNCPAGTGPENPENYSFNLSLPAINNYNSPIGIPGTGFSMTTAKLINLVIDQTLTGCKVTEKK
jgi:hypothetical protein